MKTISKEELKERVDKHDLYLRGDPAGEYLVLIGYDLSGSDLNNVNLWGTIGNMREVKSLQL